MLTNEQFFLQNIPGTPDMTQDFSVQLKRQVPGTDAVQVFVFHYEYIDTEGDKNAQDEPEQEKKQFGYPRNPDEPDEPKTPRSNRK